MVMVAFVPSLIQTRNSLTDFLISLLNFFTLLIPISLLHFPFHFPTSLNELKMTDRLEMVYFVDFINEAVINAGNNKSMLIIYFNVFCEILSQCSEINLNYFVNLIINL